MSSDPVLVAWATGAIGLAVVATVVAWRAAAARRRQATEEARLEIERLAMSRLAWLTGRSAVAPEVAPVIPSRLVAGRPAEAPRLSPRRQLGRDASAVLLVAALGILVVSFVRPARVPDDGGVLAATAQPPPSSPTGAPPATPAPLPTQATAPPGVVPTSPAPTEEPVPVPAVAPRPPQAPTPTPTPRPTAPAETPIPETPPPPQDTPAPPPETPIPEEPVP